MNNSFFSKLAGTSLKKNAKIYLPYILTCIGTVMMYYMIRSMADNKSLSKVRGGDELKMILDFGSYVVIFFAILFLFYTNSFIMKQRKKELGLLNILGLGKRHIALMMLYETIYIAIVSLGVGIGGGILVSKGMFLLLMKLVHFSVTVQVEISMSAIMATLILFGIIFALTYANILRQIHFANTIELLKGGQVGEREPKTKWLLTVAGIITLGAGYVMAQYVDNPLTALNMFFVAVLLVIVGTFCLFTAGSIAILKLMRNNKKYYYQTKHFTNVSGMIYRMKQNAAGLANICILSTTVLVMLSTTISMYLGMEKSLDLMYPRQMLINTEVAGNVMIARERVLNTVQQQGTEIQNEITLATFEAKQENGVISPIKDTSFQNYVQFCMLTADEYNQYYGGSDVTLKKNEILLQNGKSKFEDDVLKLGNSQYKVVGYVDDIEPLTRQYVGTIHTYYMVVSDRDAVTDMHSQLYQESQEDQEGQEIYVNYYYGFDTRLSLEKQVTLYEELVEALDKMELTNVSGKAFIREQFLALHGGLLFLGIFLGTLFVMATVLIIYYKQISEGYDDRERFSIMKKVGMSYKEIKQAIGSQVLTVFFLPLVMAGIHIAFAFKMIVKLLELLGLMDVTLFAWCMVGTLLVFGVFYGIVYAWTARVYYRIVS